MIVSGYWSASSKKPNNKVRLTLKTVLFER